MPGTGGNPDEGRCDYVLKEYADELQVEVHLECPYDSSCKLHYLMLHPIIVSDDINYCGRYQYKMVKNGQKGLVERDTKVVMNIDSDGHLRFSLFDINNVENKYDFDLSGIIHSYTVRGDSVDVNVMKGCSLKLYYCNKEAVYGNQLIDGKYTFLASEGCDKESSYRCLWHNQGPLEHDDLNIDATIYWK